MTNTKIPVAISLDMFVTDEHLDATRHALTSHRPVLVEVDGDIERDAMPCECGRWVEVPHGEF